MSGIASRTKQDNPEVPDRNTLKQSDKAKKTTMDYVHVGRGIVIWNDLSGGQGHRRNNLRLILKKCYQ